MAHATDPCLVVLTTAGSDELAERIASALVERRLAACVNLVGPIRSLYRWEGKLARDEERLLVIKTTARRFEELRAAIRELHDYDLPEIVALPVETGDRDYLAWVAAAVDSEGA